MTAQCGVQYPGEPRFKCTLPVGHDRLKASFGTFDHANTWHMKYWNEPSNEACGVEGAGTKCTYIKGHGRITDPFAYPYDHGNPSLGVFWDEPKPCGASTMYGPCQLPSGHNRGKADIPENHEPVRTDMDTKTPLEILEDLARRMARADKALRVLSDAVTNPKEKRRLTQRASGVRLALSYVDEEIRMLRVDL